MLVQPLGWEDPPEEEMATHSIILGLGNAMDRGAWWVTVHGFVKESGHDLATKQQSNKCNDTPMKTETLSSEERPGR